MEDANGRIFFANKATKETSWVKPAFLTAKAVPVQDQRVSRQSATKQKETRAAAPAAAALPDLWREVVDKKSGKTYYFNKQTNETRWTHPSTDMKRPESVATVATVSTAIESLYPETHARKIYMQKEDGQGRPYWVNAKTRATSWNMPPGWDDPVPGALQSAAAAGAVAFAASDSSVASSGQNQLQATAAQAASEDEEEEAVDANEAATAADGTQAGVGLFFDTHAKSGGSMVKAVYSGSSAARSGKVAIGDLLCSIDGQDVQAQGPSIVRLMIVGPQGSYVTLSFAKDGKAADTYEVKLLRGSAESIAVLAAKGLELHAEIDALTQVIVHTRY